MRLMSGYVNRKESGHSPNYSLDYANELNNFYSGFDNHDFTSEVENLLTLSSVDSD